MAKEITFEKQNSVNVVAFYMVMLILVITQQVIEYRTQNWRLDSFAYFFKS
jgi:hypothetical protein